MVLGIRLIESALVLYMIVNLFYKNHSLESLQMKV